MNGGKNIYLVLNGIMKQKHGIKYFKNIQIQRMSEIFERDLNYTNFYSKYDSMIITLHLIP